MKVILLLSLVAYGQAQMKPGCLASHCAKEMAKALVNPMFYKNSACELGCQNNFDKDKTPEKLHYQNCTTTCAVTYESEAGDAFTACAMSNNCMSLPSIPGKCAYKKEHIQADASLASLTGEWWQHRGKNALWDCYDCQHIHSMFLSNNASFCAETVSPRGTVQAPCWSYTYSYDLYLETGGTKTFEQTWQLPSDTPKGGQIDIYYNYMGSWHNESWFILQATDNYVLLGDCSYMMDWIDVGSIVWVRPGHNLTDVENAAIKEQYKSKLGWDYDGFCYDKHGSDNSGSICRNPAKPNAETFPARPRIFTHAPPGHKRPFLTPAQIDAMKAEMTIQIV